MSRLFEVHAAAPASGYAEALRQAQLTLLADPQTAHPLHWAGFSLIGGTGGSSSPNVAGVLP
jgi:CHAT domain-containing protein